MAPAAAAPVAANSLAPTAPGGEVTIPAGQSLLVRMIDRRGLLKKPRG